MSITPEQFRANFPSRTTWDPINLRPLAPSSTKPVETAKVEERAQKEKDKEKNAPSTVDSYASLSLGISSAGMTLEQFNSNFLYRPPGGALAWDPLNLHPVAPFSKPEVAQAEKAAQEVAAPSPASYTPLPPAPPRPKAIKYANLSHIATTFGNGMNEMLLMGVETSRKMSLLDAEFHADLGEAYKKNIDKYRKETEEEEKAVATQTGIQKGVSMIFGAGQAMKGLEIMGDGLVNQSPAKVASGAVMCAGGAAGVAAEFAVDKTSALKPWLQIASKVTALLGFVTNSDSILSKITSDFGPMAQGASTITQTYYKQKACAHQAEQQHLSAEKATLEHEQSKIMNRQRKLLGEIKGSSYVRTIKTFSDHIDDQNKIKEKILRKGG